MNLTRERAFRLRRNLADAGFCEGDIEKFIKLDERGERREQFLMLENRRRALLLQLHDSQYMIDCLDHMLSVLQRKNKTTEDKE